MNPLDAVPFTTIGKSNFSPIIVADRGDLLEWWLSLRCDQWHESALSGKHPMLLLWLSERGLITTRSEIQWYPPNRPPYRVSAILEHSGPFLYRRFIEAFGKLQCVMPEWRESLHGSDWEVPAVTYFKSNRQHRAELAAIKDIESVEAWIASIESTAQFAGQNGVTSGQVPRSKKRHSLEDALANVQKLDFRICIASVKFDGETTYAAPLVRDRRTGKMNSECPELLVFRPDLSPEQAQLLPDALANFEGPLELPIPKTCREVEFNLWMNGQMPHYRPTRGEQRLRAFSNIGESRAAKRRLEAEKNDTRTPIPRVVDADKIPANGALTPGHASAMMLVQLRDEPELWELSVRQWQQRLGCTKHAISGKTRDGEFVNKTYGAIVAKREATKDERRIQ